jgi:hypothetical protein
VWLRALRVPDGPPLGRAVWRFAGAPRDRPLGPVPGQALLRPSAKAYPCAGGVANSTGGFRPSGGGESPTAALHLLGEEPC